MRGIRAVGNGGGGNVGYCATKGAVEMLTKAYASDLRPNVQVNAIGPTITYTPMMVGILPDDPAERAKLAAAMPAMRIGEVDDMKGPPSSWPPLPPTLSPVPLSTPMAA